MASNPIRFTWECSECGTLNQRELSRCDLTCDACGANELVFGNDTERYNFNVAQNHSAFPRVLESKPFAKAGCLPEELCKLIKSYFPQFFSAESWSEFSVFDLLWISMAKPELAWELPFEELSEDAWSVIWDCCKRASFCFKRFIASKSASWLESVGDMDVTQEDLSCAVNLYKRQDWFEKNSDALKGFAIFISDIVAKRSAFSSLVSSLPRIIQLEIWQRSSDCPGLLDSVLEDLDPETSIHLLSDPRKKDKILSSYPFEKFSGTNWRQALRVVSDGQTDRFKEYLWDVWDSLNLSNDEIYSTIESNPFVCYLLPFDRFTVSQFLYILTLVQVEGLDLTSYCPFEKFSGKDWMQLLRNYRIPYSSNIEDAIRSCDVIAKLSKAERFGILKSNPNAVRYFNAEAIPGETAVEIYLEYPKAELPSSLIFTSCSKELVRKLLTRCGDRVPPCAQDLLRINSLQAFTSEELNDIVKANRDLGLHIPIERVSELKPEVFMDLVIKYHGARFLSFNYDLRCLAFDDIKKLIKLYPWVSEKVDPSEWTCDEVYEASKFSPEILGRYPHKIAYFRQIHPFAYWLVVCCCAISLVALLVSAVAGGVECLSNAIHIGAQQDQLISAMPAMMSMLTSSISTIESDGQVLMKGIA